MSKKNPVTTTEQVDNLKKFFGKSFFCEPEILDITENSLVCTQQRVDQEQENYQGSEDFKYLTSIKGHIIRNLTAEKPKIFGNSLFFEKSLESLCESYGANNIRASFQAIDKYSGTMTVGITTMAKTISKGDILNPGLIFKNSLTGLFNPGISFTFDRVWCSNGARRKEVITYEDLTPEILAQNGNFFGRFIEANTEMQYAKLLEMQAKPLKNSFLEKDITEQVCDMGYPKKFTDKAHFTIHKECEELAVPLNAFIAYNGFNKILFERQDTSLNLDKKEKLDDKIFEFLLNVN